MQDEILKFIGEVIVYGGGAVVLAYGAFIFLGKRWIENKFSQSLHEFKHEQNKELEEVKYKINAMLNRVTKIHEKEFEVLPSAWELLHEAIVLLTRFTSIFKQYPDVDAMTESQLDGFLVKSFLSDYQKNEIIKAHKKLNYYQECVFYHEMNDARNKIVEFHNYIQKNRIFLSDDLKIKFNDIDEIMWDAYVSMEVGEEVKDHKMKREAWKKVKDEIEPVKNEIEELVQKRLRYDSAE